MFLSRSIRSLSAGTLILGTAAAFLLAAGPAAANPPYVPPGSKGYQASMIYLQSFANEYRPVFVPEVPVVIRYVALPLRVTVTVPAVRVPAPDAPQYVTVRGPDGEVRRIPLAGGREVISRPEVIVLQPGDSTTIRIGATQVRK